MRSIKAIPILLLALAALSYVTTAASAAVVTDRPLLYSFDGNDTTAGAFVRPTSVAVDNQTGAVYVVDEGRGAVAKFDSSGAATPFTALGSSSLIGGDDPFLAGYGMSAAVDNSGRPGHQGDLLVRRYAGGKVQAFASSGSRLWTLNTDFQPCDTTVDASGHPWAGEILGGNKAWRYASDGSPPSLLDSISLLAGDPTCRLDVDTAGNLYFRYEGGIHKYVGGAFDSTLDPEAFDVYANQSTTLPTPAAAGHIFTVASGDFQEYSSDGTLLGTYGVDYVDSSPDAASVAYDPTLDRAYVAEATSDSDPRPVVAVFGPLRSGTVPNVTEMAVPSAVGISSAHFSAQVNPQGVSATAHFEWKRPSESWAAAATSGPLALPVDEAAHTVEFDTNRLRGNTTYEVRLATVNDADKLRAVSAEIKEFTTEGAAEAPAVTLAPVTTFGTTTATVDGTVDPQGDTADWRVQLQAGCAGNFFDLAWQTIAEGSASPVSVAYDLSGLLPSERYCVRLRAANSAGAQTTAEVREFTTEPVIPDGVETVPVAPRTDTGARLNGRVNPEGANLTYRFEYSDDGGATWIALPDREDTSEARRQIIVSEELGGLSPNTTYRYRFSVENAAGAASPQGKEGTFSTRTVAEVTLPHRGVEMVNQPDKGNQNPVALPFDQGGEPFSVGGERLLWLVRAGAPGVPTGTGGIFLSERASSGWESRSLLPPAKELEGRGEVPYTAMAASPDLGRFLVAPGSFTAQPPAGAILRYDAGQQGEPLAQFSPGDTVNKRIEGEAIDTTADLSHVLRVNPATGELVDIGSGTSEVVGLLPGGAAPPCGIDSVNGFFAAVSNFASNYPGYHWIATTDASRVFFLARPGSDCSAPLNLYVRNSEAGTTTQVATGHGLGGGQGNDIEFIRARRDGRAAFFLSKSPQVASDTNNGIDVYRWEEGQGLTCMTCVVPDANVGRAGSSGFGAGFVMVSDDFSHFYFISPSELVPGRGPGLYVFSNGSIRKVAQGGEIGASLGKPAAKLTPDGNVLVFESSTALTSDRIAPTCNGDPCREIYRYDDRDGSLECLSCLRGRTTTERIGGDGGSDVNDVGFDLSDDGGTVVFTTAQALVPADVNGRVDVYEWHNGALGLITDGVTRFGSAASAPALIGADGDARDVFFSVAQRGLTGFEQDRLANLYDARIGGGFTPPSPPQHCIEDACQGPLPAARLATTPGSASLVGPGNVKAVPRSRCARNKVRRRGRCVRPHRKRPHPKRGAHGRNGRTK